MISSIVIIKAVWTNNLCLFEKKECSKKLNEKKYNLYERVYTYEGEAYHSRNGKIFFIYSQGKKKFRTFFFVFIIISLEKITVCELCIIIHLIFYSLITNFFLVPVQGFMFPNKLEQICYNIVQVLWLFIPPSDDFR